MHNRMVADIVRQQHPVTLPPDATVQQACAAMRDHRIGAVLVVGEDATLLGIFTGRDAVCRLLVRGLDSRLVTLREVMTHDPVTLPPKASALDALRLMQDGGFRHVPVVAEGRIAGIVSRGDFRAVEHGRLDEETGFFERVR